MDTFYAKINELFQSIINKNESIISEIDVVKEKCAQMLDELIFVPEVV